MFTLTTTLVNGNFNNGVVIRPIVIKTKYVHFKSEYVFE
jgi:hypothetical protein